MIQNLIKKFGVNNLTFHYCPNFYDEKDNSQMLEMKIDESRYPVANNYKITLKSQEPLAFEHFYISDLEDMIKHNRIEVTVDKNNSK